MRESVLLDRLLLLSEHSVNLMRASQISRTASRHFLLRASDAFVSSISIPSSLQAIAAQVVLPMPGGPERSAALKADPSDCAIQGAGFAFFWCAASPM
ncbi:hypothetical protein L596_013585 [Steinernema carpocapsae]|uniref:Uncharacterized protein n=1 Tax=Steinernema carpocapsae TaxID=34508 RepID=A0A4U5P0N2_STECR|nr:hypothetical protein L596_013585 [Steinernema carpocapsae]